MCLFLAQSIPGAFTLIWNILISLLGDLTPYEGHFHPAQVRISPVARSFKHEAAALELGCAPASPRKLQEHSLGDFISQECSLDDGIPKSLRVILIFS